MFSMLSQSSLMLSFYMLALFVCLFFYLFVCLFFCFFWSCFNKKRRKNKKNTKIVRVCVYWYLCILDGL